VLATIGYRGTQHLSATRAALQTQCWTWHWLPFDTVWLVPYLSMFGLMVLPWFLLPLNSLRRFSLAILGPAACAWATFLVYPTACVRPNPASLPAIYQAFVFLDGPNNCLPCLHATFVVVPAWFLAAETRPFRTARSRALLIVWVFVILLSIVALRQHTDIDMLVGVLLGIGAVVLTRP